jgi:enoyl-CoA hydratase/carnithine racemase
MHENGALEIRLNRPKKFNSLDSEMLTIINAALDAHLGDGSVSPSCAGVLITAVEGRAFCAGGDVNHLASLSREDKVRYYIIGFMAAATIPPLVSSHLQLIP